MAQVDADFGSFPSSAPVEPSATAAAKKKAAPAPKPPTKAQIEAVADLSAEVKHQQELDLKSDLVRRVHKYYERFPKQITFQLPKGFGIKMTLEEIQHVVSNVELDLCSAGGFDFVCAGYEQLLGGLQDVSKRWNPLKLALSGPVADVKGSVAAQRSVWVPIVQELAIKYERYFAVGPEKRLLFFTVSLIMQIHNANTTPEAVHRQAQQPADQSLVDELNDINR